MKANLANRPTVERVRGVLDYDPSTGILRWKITSGRAFAGKEAGSLDKTTGYRRVRIDGHFILAHHVAVAIQTGAWPMQIDHADGDKDHNAWHNLRPSNQSENMHNIGLPKHNTSGLLGASFHKASGRWIAQIRIDGVTQHIGLYGTREEAADAYAETAQVYFGEFAKSLAPAPRVRKEKESAPKRAPGRPTVEEVRARLVYDPDTGIFRWGSAGPVAGQLTHDGYIRIGMFGKHYLAHILVWVVVCGEWPTYVIHHIDANRANNRWKNLAHVSQSENVAATINDFEPLHWQQPDVGTRRERKFVNPFTARRLLRRRQT